MGVTDKMWDAITTIIGQQQKIESLTERVIRLETALEIGLARGGRGKSPRRIEHKG